MKKVLNSYVLRIILCVILSLLIASSSFSQVSENRRLRDDPVIICPADMVVNAGSDSCSAYVVVPQPEVISSCGEYELTNNYTGTSNASDCYDVGITGIWWYVSDTCGTDSCMMTITVIDDQPPAITCPDDVLGYANETACEGYIDISLAFTTDNCEVDSIWNGYNLTSDASDIYEVGDTDIWLYAVDIHGNRDSCTMTISVIDTVPPVITCPDDIVQLAGQDSCEAFVVVPLPEVFDNCQVDVAINRYNGTINASDVYIVGTTEVWWYVSDMYGNSDSCMMTITVIDTQPPWIYYYPDSITGLAGQDSCEGYITVPQLVVYENCEIDNIWNGYNLSNDASDVYDVGITEVWWYMSDIYGNTDSCITIITVNDNQPPLVMCPADTIIYTQSSEDVFVVVPQPEVFENCWLINTWNSYTGTDDASEYYPIGETLITWYAVDVYGNVNSCDMTIQITDNYAIDEKEIVSFVIYPNPTDGTFTISYTISENEAVNLKIIDLAGQVVYVNKNLNVPSGQENQIDVTGLRKGIYIVRLETASGIVIKKVTVI